MIKKIMCNIKSAFDTGFFHIMICNILNNLFAFISGILLVRIISKTEYGIYSYANNTISYFLIFSGLGMTSATFQLCCENHNKKSQAQSIFRYGFRWGYIVNAILCTAAFLYSFFSNTSIKGTGPYLACMSLLPITNISLEYITIYFRSRLDNKRYSYILVINAALTCACSILGAILFGVYGIIFLGYLPPILCCIIAKLFMGYHISRKNKSLAPKLKTTLWKMAITATGSNAVYNMMYLIDISVIGTFMKDERAVASYKIASTIPTAMNFIPYAAAIYFYPFFASHMNDIDWTRQMVKKLVLGASLAFGGISLGMLLLADHIVPIIFGTQYTDAVPVFQVLCISFFFQATFRVIFGNLLTTQRKLTINLVSSILTGVVNILGDILLVRPFKAMGVALSTLVVMIFSGVFCMSCYFYTLRKKEVEAKQASLGQ